MLIQVNLAPAFINITVFKIRQPEAVGKRAPDVSAGLCRVQSFIQQTFGEFDCVPGHREKSQSLPSQGSQSWRYRQIANTTW